MVLPVIQIFETRVAGVFALLAVFLWRKLDDSEFSWRIIFISLSIFSWTWIGPDVPKVLGLTQIDFHSELMVMVSWLIIGSLVLVEKKRMPEKARLYWLFVFGGLLLHLGTDRIFTSLA